MSRFLIESIRSIFSKPVFLPAAGLGLSGNGQNFAIPAEAAATFSVIHPDTCGGLSVGIALDNSETTN